MSERSFPEVIRPWRVLPNIWINSWWVKIGLLGGGRKWEGGSSWREWVKWNTSAIFHLQPFLFFLFLLPAYLSLIANCFVLLTVHVPLSHHHLQPHHKPEGMESSALANAPNPTKLWPRMNSFSLKFFSWGIWSQQGLSHNCCPFLCI